MPDPVYAWIADLRASRAVEDRPGLAHRLGEALQHLGLVGGDAWLAPPRTVKGIDEISGLLRTPAPAFDALVHLHLSLWPLQFRVGLGEGDVDVARRTGDAGAMDGSAFHRAAAALDRAGDQDLPFAIARADDAPTAVTVAAEALAALHVTWTGRWTARQTAAALAYRDLGHQRDAARRLGVSQPAVSRHLRAAAHDELVRAEAALRGLLPRCFAAEPRRGADA
ncbi:MAG: SatD family protein [Planctomycetota bacterium]